MTSADICTVIALIVLITLLPAQIVVRERKGWKRKAKPSMDWNMFRDITYLLVAAGTDLLSRFTIRM